MKRIVAVAVMIVMIFSSVAYAGTDKALLKAQSEPNFLPKTLPEAGIKLMSTNESLEAALVECWENFEEELDISEYNIPVDEFEDIYTQILFSNPELYYVLTWCTYGYYEEDGCVCEVYPEYATTDRDQIAETLEKIESAADEILFLISENMSDFDKIMTVHDYMVEHYSYDWDFVENEDAYDGEYHSQYTLEILITKIGVCQAYTLAFSYVMNKLGIDCRFVSSEEMNHAWNLVKVDGKWYHIDVTWDDTDECSVINHDYELISSQCIQTLPNPHYGFDLGGIEADSVIYDNASWKDNTAEVAYCHGKSYWISGDDIVDEDGNIIFENLAGADGLWDFGGGVVDAGGKVYSGLADYNGRLYFNTDKAIYTYNPHTGKTKKIIEDSFGGGLCIHKNILIYCKPTLAKVAENSYTVEFIEEGHIVLEHARFSEPYIVGDKVVTRLYKDCEDPIRVLAVSDLGIETAVIKDSGYSSVKFSAGDDCKIYFWTSNLKPLRDVEKVIIK